MNGRLPHKTPEEFWERFRPPHSAQSPSDSGDQRNHRCLPGNHLRPDACHGPARQKADAALPPDVRRAEALNRLAAVWKRGTWVTPIPCSKVPQHWPLTWKPGMQITRSYGPAAVRRASSIALARPSSGWLIISGKPSHALGGFWKLKQNMSCKSREIMAYWRYQTHKGSALCD